MTERTETAATPVPARAQPGARYVAALLGALGVLLGAVLALNLLLGEREVGNAALTRAASEWQQATKGVTYAPPITVLRPWKALRLHDRLPEINAIVLGASSVMGVTETMFPEGIRAYNLSQPGNPLAASLGEARYVQKHFPGRIKWYVVPLDWSIGFMFEKAPPYDIDISPPAALKAADDRSVPLHKRVLDALSYPKVENLGVILADVLRAPDKAKAFRQVFFEAAGDEYPCPDGTPAKDYDVLYRGRCGGFHYDGHTTFRAWKWIRSGEVQPRTVAAGMASSKYAQALAATGGAPNLAYLEETVRLHRELKASGGGVIAFLPPLIPGLEEALSKGPQSGASLKRFKDTVAAWAEKERIPLLDAGRSERYGCEPLEFVDEHHARRECLQKIFDRFWKDQGRK